MNLLWQLNHLAMLLILNPKLNLQNPPEHPHINRLKILIPNKSGKPLNPDPLDQSNLHIRQPLHQLANNLQPQYLLQFGLRLGRHKKYLAAGMEFYGAVVRVRVLLQEFYAVGVRDWNRLDMQAFYYFGELGREPREFCCC